MFRVGQKVVCVDVREPFGRGNWTGINKPALNAVYTVRDLYEEPFTGGPVLLLNEISNPLHWSSDLEPGFRQSRFRPAVDRKTNIAIFTRILDDVNRKQTVRA